MHSLVAIVASAAAAACLVSAPDPTIAHAPSDREATLRRYGLDPTSSLDSRVRPAPAATLRMFEVPIPPPAEPTGKPAPATTAPEAANPASHVLTTLERRALSAAVNELPSLHQRMLRERLRAIYFVDAPAMSGTALTVTITEDEPYALFDLVVRGTIFRESVSEFLTSKERTCFDASGSSLSVSIEAGRLDAIRYVMLHEATHIVDKSIQFTPLWRSTGPLPERSSLVRGRLRQVARVYEVAH